MTNGMDSDFAMEDNLRPLHRLRQLAAEIEQGLERNDMELVCQAASLLGPAIALWNETHESLPVSASEAAQLALTTRQTLSRCEAGILNVMGRMTTELRRMRQGRQTLRATRRRSTSGLHLDDLR